MPKATSNNALFGWFCCTAIRKIASTTFEVRPREMRVESVAKSIKMLKEILDGKAYLAVAQEFALSRSAVEQRVKALARDLQTRTSLQHLRPFDGA